MANNILAKLTANQTYVLTDDNFTLDPEIDFRSGWWNVTMSVSSMSNSPYKDNSHPDDHTLYSTDALYLYLYYVALICVPNVVFIFIVRPSKEPGWLEGTLNGRTGLIPENYVEPIT